MDEKIRGFNTSESVSEEYLIQKGLEIFRNTNGRYDIDDFKQFFTMNILISKLNIALKIDKMTIEVRAIILKLYRTVQRTKRDLLRFRGTNVKFFLEQVVKARKKGKNILHKSIQFDRVPINLTTA